MSGDCLLVHSDTQLGENLKPFLEAQATVVCNQEMLIQEVLGLEHFWAPVTLNGPFTHMDKLVFIQGGFVHKTHAADITEMTLDAFMCEEVFLERGLHSELDTTDVADLAEPVAVVPVGPQRKAAVEMFAALIALLQSLPGMQSAYVLLQVTFDLKFFPTKLTVKITFLFNLPFD